MGIDAGKLTHRLRFIRDGAPVHDGMALVAGDDVTLAESWAEHRHGRGSERLENARIGAELMTAFRVRYTSALADLNPKDRFVERANGADIGPVYDIKSVTPLGRNDVIEVIGAARPDAGE